MFFRVSSGGMRAGPDFHSGTIRAGAELYDYDPRIKYVLYCGSRFSGPMKNCLLDLITVTSLNYGMNDGISQPVAK